jgi:sensor histidine kinase YesM
MIVHTASLADPSNRMLLRRTLGVRLLWVFGLNAAIGLFIAITLWWLQSKGDLHALPGHLSDSFIHSFIYGTMFGLGMAYLAERLETFRSPWNWISIIASLAVIAVAATMAVQLSLLATNLLISGRFWPEFGYKSALVFLIALIIALSFRGYENFRDQIQATTLELRTQQLETERARKLMTEARLSSLESKLHPHFLFNTLNTISALISEDPALAEQMVQRLAALLRISLDTRADQYIPLTEEIKLVLDYAEIEKARLGKRLSLSMDVSPELGSLSIPPMSLQPLVENSIKYAISPKLEGGEIRVSAREQNGQLIVSVWDTGPGFTMDEISAGHSIDNLRARLRNMLGEKASVFVMREGDGTTVTVSLPAMNSLAQ